MSLLQQVEQYCEWGLAVVPVPFQSKQCTFPGWQNTKLAKKDLPRHFNGEPQNVAAVCGSLSDGQVVVDCDWPEAAQIARYIFDDTVAYGRAGSPYSHFVIKCPALSKTVTFKVPPKQKPTDRRTSIIEVLSNGHLCLLPGSTHENGDATVFAQDPLITPVVDMAEPDLIRWCKRIQGAAVLLNQWDSFEGSRHDLMLSLAGACLHSGWTEDDVGRLFASLIVASDDEVRDRQRAVTDTIEKFKAGDNISGWPTAAPLLGDDLANLLQDSWQLNQNPLDMLVINTESGRKDDWPELVPFQDIQAAERIFPVHALGSLETVVNSVAHTQQVPIGLAAQCVLAGVATAVQGLFDIKVPHATYPLSLFMLTLGETGDSKSSTDALVFAPHEQWMQAALKQIADDEEGYRPFMFYEGGSIEGLRKQLSKYWPSIVCNNSDAVDFLGGHSMREGRDKGTAAFLSKLWDGRLRGYMRGQDDKPVTLLGRRVSVTWMLQPQHVEGLVNKDLASQGLLSRFLICYPRSRIGKRKYVFPSATDSSNLVAYDDRITSLLNSRLDLDPVTGCLSPIALRLSDDAEIYYAELHDDYEQSLDESGLNFSIREQANKAGQHLARIAGVLSAYEAAPNVTKDHLTRAKTLLDYYLSEWRALEPRLDDLATDVQKPKAVLDFLYRYQDAGKMSDSFKLEVIYQNGPRPRSAPKAKAYLQPLITRGYVRQVPGNRYQLRPRNV